MVTPPVGTRWWLDALPQHEAAEKVRAVALEVIEAEGPVHEVRLSRAVAASFDLTRLSDARIRSILDVVPTGLRGAEEPAFLWPEHRSPDTWDGFRRTGAEAPHRAIEDVSLREIGNAMRALCQAGGGVEREEVLREALGVFSAGSG